LANHEASAVYVRCCSRAHRRSDAERLHAALDNLDGKLDADEKRALIDFLRQRMSQ
jgi:hypothetical protein